MIEKCCARSGRLSMSQEYEGVLASAATQGQLPAIVLAA
jgi:hypothetical protein